jgi:hypothetical protein
MLVQRNIPIVVTFYLDLIRIYVLCCLPISMYDCIIMQQKVVLLYILSSLLWAKKVHWKWHLLQRKAQPGLEPFTRPYIQLVDTTILHSL